MRLSFTKMEGAGNDFIFINAIKDNISLSKAQAQKLCDRHFGIGADQILIVRPSSTSDFRMDIINADGGVVEMCGNGIRCFAKYVRDIGLTQKTKLDVETLAGIIRPEIIDNHSKNSSQTLWVKVDMGEPILEGKQIPVEVSGKIIKYSLDESPYPITCVSMGNPHCVLFVGDVREAPVAELGSTLERHRFFPKRTNVEFVEVQDRKNLKMRVWERGTGETLACGTGACATAVAGVLTNKSDRNVTLHLTGGDLEILWDEKTNHVFMTGPATTVFEGEIEM